MVEKYNFPPGSRGYDYENLPYEQYLKKYFADIPEEWEEMMNTIKLAFSLETRTDFIKLWGMKAQTFSFDKMLSFFNDIKDEKHFERDILLFVSVMAGDGYFDSIENPSFQTWINDKNIDNTGRTIIEHVALTNGMNAIRYKLISLRWWKFR